MNIKVTSNGIDEVLVELRGNGWEFSFVLDNDELEELKIARADLD